jgi:hypothetical protein
MLWRNATLVVCFLGCFLGFLVEPVGGATTVRTPRRLDPVMERHFKIKTGQLRVSDDPLDGRSVAPPVSRSEARAGGGGGGGGGYSPCFGSDARDVVVGMVWGVDADTSRFVRSWLWHAPDVRMVLLVPPGQDLARKAYLQEWGVELRPWPQAYTNEYGELKRFELYYELMLELQEEASRHEAAAHRCARADNTTDSLMTCADAKLADSNRSPYVLLSDVRDVVVQSNPFAMARDVAPGKIVFSMEDSRVTLGACPFNSQWILELYGGEMLEDMADRHISCSGVTLGPLAPMLRYVRTMRKFTGRVLAKNDGTKAIRKGSDQGIHNCVVHGFCRDDDSRDSDVVFDATRDAALLPNEASAVQTLGWVPWDIDLRRRIDGLGRVRDSAGRVVPLLHQFDRHAELYRVVLGMYPWWEPTVDAAEMERRETRRKRKKGTRWKNMKKKKKKKKKKKEKKKKKKKKRTNIISYRNSTVI